MPMTIEKQTVFDGGISRTVRWPEYVTTPRGEEWWIPNEPAAAA